MGSCGIGLVADVENMALRLSLLLDLVRRLVKSFSLVGSSPSMVAIRFSTSIAIPSLRKKERGSKREEKRVRE